jgi:hypothetical protein
MPSRKPVQNHQIYRMFKEQNVRSWAEMFGSGQIQAKIGLFKICHPERSRARRSRGTCGFYGGCTTGGGAAKTQPGQEWPGELERLLQPFGCNNLCVWTAIESTCTARPVPPVIASS